MRRHMWKQQLHIFEVPFYYIEYGMAQLGALSIYMNYRQDKAKALQQYQAFMELAIASL
jgi:oligoendopeptidase F